MDYHTFDHLDRTWEAAVPRAPGERCLVRFRRTDDRDAITYEARVDAEELTVEQPRQRELALRRALESALVLDVLARHPDGLTLGEVAERTGMPPEAAEDRLHVLDEAQPVPEEMSRGRRYRLVERP
jgi:hypothetical protein